MSAEPFPVGKLDSRLRTILWWIVSASLLATSLVFTIGAADWWRWPKEIVLRGAAIVLAALLITIALVGNASDWRSLVREHGKLVLLVAAIVMWGGVAFAFSTNRAVGPPALAYTASLIVVFIATFLAAGERSVLAVMAVPMIAGLINALMAISQRMEIWNPFPFDPRLPKIHFTTGLQGSSNDAADYLLVILFAVIALALVRKSVLAWIAVAIFTIAIAMTQSLAALVAAAAGVGIIAVTRANRRRAVIAFAVLIAAGAALSFTPPVRERIHRFRSAFETGDTVGLTSARVFGWSTAWHMFRDRPLLGVGPGAYKFHYMSYRRELNERNPRWIGVFPENFGEAHSDHLQILAEEGLPGYLIFVAALVLVVRASLRARDGERARFARALGLPLVVAVAVVALAAFPLELAGTSHMLVYFLAVILRWGQP